jgi:hypothetical protein
MEANQAGLKELFEKHFESRKKFMDLKDCYALFREDTQILALEKDVMYCFGMSKMTCIVETKDAEKFYSQMQFVEFLEMIGRVAKFKYQGDPEFSKEPLAAKIEIILDQILMTIGIKRKDPEVHQEDESESDDDY